MESDWHSYKSKMYISIYDLHDTKISISSELLKVDQNSACILFNQIIRLKYSNKDIIKKK